MPKLNRISGQAAIRMLEQLGFVQIRQKGSHVILKKHTSEGELTRPDVPLTIQPFSDPRIAHTPMITQHRDGKGDCVDEK